MRLTLWYLHPGAQEPTNAGTYMPELWYLVWLDSMINQNPECIWFYTVETTDVFNIIDIFEE